MKRLASRTRSAIYAILGAVSLLLVMKRVVLRDGADVNNNPVVVSSENAENSTAKKCRPPITTSNDTSAELARTVQSPSVDWPHLHHYDVRKASPSYSNIAAYLAAFALTAMVLVIQERPEAHALGPARILLIDRASLALLLSFFGCVLAAFTFAVVAAEMRLVPRSYAVSVLGGASFALATTYLVWALVLLTHVYLSSEAAGLADWMFVGVTLVAPAYVVFGLTDIVYVFGRAGETIHSSSKPKVLPSEWITFLMAAYLPVLFASFDRWLLNRVLA